LAGFQIAIFAFVGVELVGTTAAETKDGSILFQGVTDITINNANT
jgi:L-asparagine transporter-like permease